MTGKLLQLGAVNPGIASTKVAFNSIASVINALLQASTENIWAFIGLTAAQGDGNATPITTYPAAINSALNTADRVAVLTLTSAPSVLAGMNQSVVAEGPDYMTESDGTYGLVSGRLVSAALLGASLDLPSGRESWGSAGQLIEDIISGLVLIKTNSSFSDVNPVAVVFDQTTKEFGFWFRGSGTIDWDATFTMATYSALLAPDRTTGAGFFEG